MNQEYLSTVELSQFLGISTSTIKRLRKRPNEIPWTRIGRQVRYHIHDVKGWMLDNQGRHKRDVEFWNE